MLVEGVPYRTVWLPEDDPRVVRIIDQRHLPFRWVLEDLRSVEDVAVAIRDMHVRGAGCIGATAAHGMYLATLEAEDDPTSLQALAQKLIECEPARRRARPAGLMRLDLLRNRILAQGQKAGR